MLRSEAARRLPVLARGLAARRGQQPGRGGHARRHGRRGGAHGGTAATARGAEQGAAQEAATRSSAGEEQQPSTPPFKRWRRWRERGSPAWQRGSPGCHLGSPASKSGQPRWQPRWQRGSLDGSAALTARLPKYQRQAAKMSARGCQNVSAGLPKCQRQAAKMSARGCLESWRGCHPGCQDFGRGCLDGSAALTLWQPRMAARLPRALTAPLCRRRATLETPVPTAQPPPKPRELPYKFARCSAPCSACRF